MLQCLGPTHQQMGRAKASGCCCFFGDDLSHRPVITECPRLAGRYVSGGNSLLDFLRGAMSGEPDHSIPYAGAGAAGLAGGVRIGGGADRDASSGWCVPRQRSRAVTPVSDRLGPLIPLPLEPVANRAAGISSGEHGHDGGDPQVGQPVRMRGGVGRKIDREPGLDARGDQAPVSTATGSSPRTGLWTKAMAFLPVLAATSSWKSSSSICGPYPGRSPAWA